MSSYIPGKLILVGEHSVVYGEKAIVVSIDRGVRVKVLQRREGEKTEEYSDDKKNLIPKAIELAGGDGSIKVSIESSLPVGAGMGSSAAVSAAVIRGVREFLDNPIENDELFNLVMECERVAHGNPSGIDPAAVIYQGLIVYVKGKPIEKLEKSKMIKMLVVDSGRPADSTKEMVEMVAKKINKVRVIKRMGEIAEEVEVKLVQGEDIAKLIDENGRLLEELGVVGERARGISNKLREIGCSIKITGAGGVETGSGMMIVIPSDFAQTKRVLDNIQIGYFEAKI